MMKATRTKPAARHARKIGAVVPAAAIAALAALVLAGCADRVANWSIPGLYKLDIRQGRELHDADLTQLEVGMERAKVVHLLGSPTISDIFHADRWDYLYSYLPEGDVERREQRRITIHFEDDLITRIEGELPVDPPEGATTTPEGEEPAARVVRVPPRPEKRPLWQRIFRPEA